ncbi:MAG: crosslink repair DNA glycosylase YcaQ family protein [Pseudomonadota bacterium]
MPSTPPTADPRRLRRLLLKRQGLSQRAPFGRGRGATLRAVAQLGYVQIDTISVVERAHHHTLATRNRDHQQDHINRLLLDRALFEYWFHAAALLPMADYRFALPRMQQERDKYRSHRGAKERRLERFVLDRIEAEGPLAARHFEGSGGGGGWWDWKPAKQALERLFMQGTLMIHERQGFQKRFELSERGLPATVDRSPPTAAAQAEHLIEHALRALGYVAVDEATYLRRSKPLRDAVQAQLERDTAERRLLGLRFADGRRLWVDPEVYEARLPAAAPDARILSPFDNAVIHRRRLSDLFAFDYQLECYVPAAKRRFGYFVLPVLIGDRFVARLDAKLHRSRDLLEVLALHFDQTPDGTDLVALGTELARYATRQQATAVQLPGRLAGARRTARSTLQQALETELARAESTPVEPQAEPGAGASPQRLR